MNLSGTLSSDFMDLASLPVRRKANLINFANSDFISLRQGLVEYAKAAYPNEYQYFVESDLGIMFLEMVAYMGSVMSMKADMLANENILQTAKKRSSIKKLFELIGVSLKGPLSSAADASITFSQDLTQSVIFTGADRVINTISPEDGDALSFTLYKVTNGQIDPLNNATADIDISLATESYYSDLAIQEGALVTDSGAFRPTEGIKTIELNQGPVIEGSIQVYISNTVDTTVQGAYTEVDNIYFASGSNDKVFEVVYDDSYNATIVFGNGIAGINPPVDSTYFVVYRVGGGARGNIAKNAINTAIESDSLPVGVTATITNTSLATGGANAETLEKAKKYAPLTFRRQDRIVTLNDYSTFANSFISTWGTMGKATAALRKAYASANIVDIYILEKASDLQLQKATPTFKTNLLTEINKKKMATDEVVIVDGLIRTLDLIITIKIDREEESNQASIIAKARNNILEYMNVDNREFGQALNLAELNRQIFEIDEIRFSTVDNLERDIIVDFNEIIQLNNLIVNVELLD